MVRIIPFKGYRYNPKNVPELENVVSPPYDVIKGKLVKMFHDRSPYNISHIIKGIKYDTDDDEINEHTRAAELLESWIENDILMQEDQEAFYIYAQEFNILGGQYTRWGFIGLLELEDFGKPGIGENNFTGILQHEETLAKDIEDRLNLLRATRANFGQIFVIYPDSQGKVDNILSRRMKEEPLMCMDDGVGVIHKLWTITDRVDIENIVGTMNERFVIIADGHHRYKTALAYHREAPENKDAAYRMLSFVNMSNPGLVILPTHRLVQHIEDFDLKELLKLLEKDFDITGHGCDGQAKKEMFANMERDFRTEKHGFGIFGNDGEFYSLTLKNTGVMEEISQNRSKAWKELDVTILHSLVLERHLGIDHVRMAAGTIEGGSCVEFIKGIGDAVESAISKVKQGAQAVFFMNPTRIEEVEEVAGNYETMPQKSTFFYPKVYTGFTINKLS